MTHFAIAFVIFAVLLLAGARVLTRKFDADHWLVGKLDPHRLAQAVILATCVAVALALAAAATFAV